MRIQEIYFQDMDLSIKLKSLLPDQVQSIKNKYSSMPKLEYMLLVLDTCVYNLRAEIFTALKSMDRSNGDQLLKEMYNGCIMLNPGLDIDCWVRLTQSYDAFTDSRALPEIVRYSDLEPIINVLMDDDDDDDFFDVEPKALQKPQRKPPQKISKAKFLNLHKYLSERVIGQPEAVDEVFKSLKRAQTGLKDADRPVGVFLFTGPSGTGKTYLAKELHKYMFGNKSEFIRIDCGEFQQKHENQKLIGSASGYVGYEDGGQLTDAIRDNPATVLLLDEVEKAHPDFWGTFLNVFDDGYLTDNKGNKVSFKDVIIIMTSNLGNDKIVQENFSKGTGFTGSVDYEFGSRKTPSRTTIVDRTTEAVRKYFKPELVNRLDNIIIFNYLKDEDYVKIAELEMENLAEKLSKINFNLNWTSEVPELLTRLSGRSLEGARSISKIRRSQIEDPLADLLLESKFRRGTTFNICVKDDQFEIASVTTSSRRAKND